VLVACNCPSPLFDFLFTYLIFTNFFIISSLFPLSPDLGYLILTQS
jgi:hypothetical protein